MISISTDCSTTFVSINIKYWHQCDKCICGLLGDRSLEILEKKKETRETSKRRRYGRPAVKKIHHIFALLTKYTLSQRHHSLSQKSISILFSNFFSFYLFFSFTFFVSILFFLSCHSFFPFFTQLCIFRFVSDDRLWLNWYTK